MRDIYKYRPYRPIYDVGKAPRSSVDARIVYSFNPIIHENHCGKWVKQKDYKNGKTKKTKNNRRE